MERKGKKCRVNPYFCLDVTNSQGKRNRRIVKLKRLANTNLLSPTCIREEKKCKLT